MFLFFFFKISYNLTLANTILDFPIKTVFKSDINNGILTVPNNLKVNDKFYIEIKFSPQQLV